MSLPIANVELSDSFNTWRLRTNDVINAALPADGTVTFAANVTFTGSVTAAANVTFTGPVTATGDISAANFNTTSDVRLKQNVVTADGTKVYSMRGVLYTKDSVPGAGVIAQELVELAPELIVSDDKGYLSVRYDGLSAYLIEAIKELKSEVEHLKSIINNK